MREIPPLRLLAALTPRRFYTVIKGLTAVAMSRLQGRTFHWGAPYVLNIEPANLCDLNCLHCETGAGDLTRPSGVMDIALFRHILELNHRHLLYLLLYNQGEPLLHPQFPEMVRLAKQKRLCVVTSTNGQRLADKTYARQIVASGLDAMIISADGLSQTSYEIYRRGGSLEKVQNSLALLREARREMGKRTPQLFLQFVVMRHNEHEVPQVPAVAAEWGADRVLLKSLYLRSELQAEEILPESERLRRYTRHDGRWVRKNKSRRPCLRRCYSSVILWDGNVVPCCFDKDGAHLLGHASQPLAELYRGQAFQTFHRQLYSTSAPQICQNCSDGLKIYPS